MFNDSYRSGKFNWFIGVVEDRFDPLMMNRVKVRCFGYHEEDEAILPTSDLPWALVMNPTTTGGGSGIGSTPHGLVEGSWVVGFFMDGNVAQDPLVIGSISSFNSFGSSEGSFSGASYPQQNHLRNTDVHPNATGQNILESRVEAEFKNANYNMIDRDAGDIPPADATEAPPRGSS